MSRAEVIWFSAGKPFGLTQFDCVMPSLRELAFIMSAKPSIEPPTPSAIVTDTSFADLTMIIFSALSSVTSVPSLKPIFVGACATALRVTGSSVSSFRRPSRTAESDV